MTGEEIIEKLKELFDNVSDFAYEAIPYPSEFPQEALEAQRIKDEFYKSIEDKRNTSEWDNLLREYNKLPNKYDIAENKWKFSHNLEWKEVDSYGGVGQGETWYSVKYFPQHDVYIKVNGFYQSYNGTEFYDGWGCCEIVKPVQKTITVYE